MGFDPASYAIGKKSSGGGEPTDSIIEKWDFTSENPLLGEKRGYLLQNLSDRVVFTSDGANFESSYYKNLKLYFKGFIYGFTIEIETGDLNLPTVQNHQRFIMGTTDSGLIYRNNGFWEFYGTSNWAPPKEGKEHGSGEADGSFFSNSIVKIETYTLPSGEIRWKIYKNNVLWWEPDININPTEVAIGASDQSLYSGIIKSLTIY